MSTIHVSIHPKRQTPTTDSVPPVGGKDPRPARVGGYRRQPIHQVHCFDPGSTTPNPNCLTLWVRPIGLKPLHQPSGWSPSPTGGGLLVVVLSRFYPSPTPVPDNSQCPPCGGKGPAPCAGRGLSASADTPSPLLQSKQHHPASKAFGLSASNPTIHAKAWIPPPPQEEDSLLSFIPVFIHFQRHAPATRRFLLLP